MRWFTLCNEASRYPGIERAGKHCRSLAGTENKRASQYPGIERAGKHCRSLAGTGRRRASRYPERSRRASITGAWRVQGEEEQAGTRKEVDGQALQELKIYS